MLIYKCKPFHLWLSHSVSPMLSTIYSVIGYRCIPVEVKPHKYKLDTRAIVLFSFFGDLLRLFLDTKIKIKAKRFSHLESK